MNSKLHTHTKQSGQVIIINTLVFLTVSLLVLYGIANPLIANNTSTRSFLKSKQSFILANSAAEEAMYRLRNGMDLDASETINLNSGTATISVADTFDGKTVNVSSNVDTYVRNLELNIEQGAGTSFNYGLQAGKGGFQMAGGAGINGNVYSNGDIIGSGAPYISGSATVANSSDPVANQSNGTTFPPPAGIMFGGTPAWNDVKPEDVAQSFRVSTTTPVTSVRVYIKKFANIYTNNVTVRIVNDSSGKPGKTTLASGTLSAQQVTTSYNHLSIPFTSSPALSLNTTYWLVFDASNTWNTYYTLGASNATYANGLAKTGAWSSGNGGTWTDTSPAGLDGYFDIYVGGDTGIISGINVGTSGTGNAWAHEVNNSTISGALYCQAASGNNKACDTSRPDPVEQPMPISEGNILDWKEQGADGGTVTGNQTYGGATVTYLGPKKIVGDLTVGAGAVLHVTGTLWVTGNVSVSGGGIIRLASSYNSTSGVIVTDGRVTASGGGQFQGSGSTGSYILLVTTSTCPVGCGSSPAVSVSGGTGAVVLNAQQGTIQFSGGAQAKQATANKIIMDGGTTVNYESGLANVDFSSGPSGSWNLTEWNEI